MRNRDYVLIKTIASEQQPTRDPRLNLVACIAERELRMLDQQEVHVVEQLATEGRKELNDLGQLSTSTPA